MILSHQMLIPAIWEKACRHLPQPCVFRAGLRHVLVAGEYCQRHRHTGVEIVFHPTGRGVTECWGGKVPFSEGTAMVYAPGEWHDQRMVHPGEDLCLQMAVPHPWPRQGFFVSRVDRPWLVEEIWHLCRSQVRSEGFDQRILDLRATAVLLALVDLAVSHEELLTPSERHVRRAEQFVQEHFATIESLSAIADHVGVSPDHLRHLFKKIRGRTLVGYVNEVKIARAKTLLTSSPIPLKQIAAMCGFRDEYYLSVVFRRLTKLSPGLYRQREFGVQG